MLVIPFHPGMDERTKNLHRSAALAHAARQSHPRRLRVKSDKRAAESKLRLTLPIMISGDRGDPYNCMPFTVTVGVDVILDHWTKSCWNGPVPEETITRDTAIKKDVEVAQNSVAAHSLLLTAAANMLMSCQQECARIRLHKMVLKYKQKALESLREALSKSEDITGGALNSMLLVLIAALLTPDAHEVRIHADHLFAVLHRVQGRLDPADTHMTMIWVARMYFLDLKSALHYMRPLTLEPLRNTTMLPEEALLQALDSPQAWEDGMKGCRLSGESEDVRKLFRDVRQYMLFQKAATDLVAEHGHPASMYMFAYFSGLAGDALQLYTTARADNSHVDMVLAAAVLAILSTAVFYSEYTNNAARAAGVMRALKESIQICLKKVEARQDVLWALYVGMLWEVQVGPGLNTLSWQPWFRGEFAIQASKSGVKTWEQLEGIVRGFIQAHDIAPSRLFNGAVLGFDSARDIEGLFQESICEVGS